MRFLIAGSSGFLGTALRARLAERGHDVVRLVRGEAGTAQESHWDPYRGVVDQHVIEDADVVVNLAGSPLLGNPHSRRYRERLRQSRVATTRTLAEAIARGSNRPAYLAQNGTSFYGDRGDEVLTEDSGTGAGSLLTPITREWQQATEPAAEAGSRVCVLRTAPALHRSGGSFAPIRRVFLTGLGGRLGDGSQYFPVISLPDWVAAAVFLAENENGQATSGPYNLVAPAQATNAEFTRELGRRLHRPTVLPVPAPLIDKAAGGLSAELLGSFRVLPARLEAAGFSFAHPDLASVLDSALDPAHGPAAG